MLNNDCSRSLEMFVPWHEEEHVPASSYEQKKDGRMCTSFAFSAHNHTQEPNVTWEDQAMINQFGRVNNRLHELNAELTQKQNQLDDLQEAESEVLLADGDIRCALLVYCECVLSLFEPVKELRGR